MSLTTFRLPACFGESQPDDWLTAAEVLAFLGERGVQISADHLDRLLGDARRVGVVESQRRLEWSPSHQSWTSQRCYRLTRTGWVLLRWGRPTGRAFLAFTAPAPA